MATNSFMQGKQSRVKVSVGKEPIQAPKELPAPVRAIFRRMAKQLVNRTSPEDATILAQLAIAEWAAQQAMAEMAQVGVTEVGATGETKRSAAFVAWKQANDALLAVGAHFGMTPASRARLRIDEAEEVDLLAELFADVRPAAR